MILRDLQDLFEPLFVGLIDIKYTEQGAYFTNPDPDSYRGLCLSPLSFARWLWRNSAIIFIILLEKSA